MGCLFKSIGIIVIFVLLLPVIFLFSVFGRARHISVRRGRHDEEPTQHGGDETQYDADEQDRGSSHPDKPIDQSTVEYIDFEEVKDNAPKK